MASSSASILSPAKLWSRAEVLSKPSPVPKEPGMYGWYFRNLPQLVPTEDCIKHDDLTLAYVGIAPKEPPSNGKPPSANRLYQRITFHMDKNASGSTLRLTLGCLLSQELGIQLEPTGRTGRLTFGEGEKTLSQWLDENAFVTWMVHPEPWHLEDELIKTVSLPLNLMGNSHHPFHATLTGLRQQMKAAARN